MDISLSKFMMSITLLEEFVSYTFISKSRKNEDPDKKPSYLDLQCLPIQLLLCSILQWLLYSQSDHIKQDIFLAFQTGGYLMLH